MKRILIAMPQSTVNAMIAASERRALDEMGAVWHCELNRDSTEEEYGRVLAETQPEIVMTGWSSPKLTARLLEAHPQIKYLVNLTGELKAYVTRECLEKGLIVTNWGDVPAASVAEAALMMTLASLRQVYYWQKRMHEDRAWSGDATRTPAGLFDKTVGLYGFGLIAREFARMIRPFNPRILVLSGWLSAEDREEFGVEPVATLKDLFVQSDLVSIHTGNRPDTYHTVDAQILAAMKDGGHIVNTARGAIVDTDALVAELRRGRLFAALDVFEEEPLPADHPLRGLDRCLLFPHTGGPTHDYRFRCGENAVAQIRRYVQGDPLKYLLTIKQYDRMT
jgi:phosphoglycerate dehydrogenase-like enzyme